MRTLIRLLFPEATLDFSIHLRLLLLLSLLLIAIIHILSHCLLFSFNLKFQQTKNICMMICARHILIWYLTMYLSPYLCVWSQQRRTEEGSSPILVTESFRLVIFILMNLIPWLAFSKILVSIWFLDFRIFKVIIIKANQLCTWKLRNKGTLFDFCES